MPTMYDQQHLSTREIIQIQEAEVSSQLDNDKILNALKDLLGSNGSYDFNNENYRLIEKAMEYEFSFQDKSCDPQKLHEKSKAAFWYSFNDFFDDEEMDMFFDGPAFKDGGVFYFMAHVDSFFSLLNED